LGKSPPRDPEFAEVRLTNSRRYDHAVFNPWSHKAATLKEDITMSADRALATKPTAKEWSPYVRVLQAKAKECSDAVVAAQGELRVAQHELHTAQIAEFPLKPGDVVQTRKGAFKIISIGWINSPVDGQMRGFRRRKDGSWGIQERHLWAHEVQEILMWEETQP
jgi:hypothetical protein